jgi:hypothetical protein
MRERRDIADEEGSAGGRIKISGEAGRGEPSSLTFELIECPSLRDVERIAARRSAANDE